MSNSLKYVVDKDMRELAKPNGMAKFSTGHPSLRIYTLTQFQQLRNFDTYILDYPKSRKYTNSITRGLCISPKGSGTKY